MSKKLGKGVEIFEQTAVLTPKDDRQEIPEKTIYMVRPSERQALDEFVIKAKRHNREINNSMVVRCLLSIFAELNVPTEGIESEEMLRDRIKEAFMSMRMYR
jgi:hypothetical protein